MAKKKKVSKGVVKLHKSKRSERYYGLQVIKEGQKLSWVSAQNKYGWSLGLALGTRTIWLRNIRFNSPKEVERALGSSVVFIKSALAEKKK